MMSRLRVHAFAISLDGYGAGPDQDHDNPLRRGGTSLNQRFYPTSTFQRMFGKGEGRPGSMTTSPRGGSTNIGVWILGRNMFGPVRRP